MKKLFAAAAIALAAITITPAPQYCDEHEVMDYCWMEAEPCDGPLTGQD